MKIQHNIMAMNAYRNLGMNNSKLSKNLEKLSSGYRITRAGDDAAGLAISEKMRAQIAGLDQAQKNAQSGINLVQTAEGALTEVHDMLNRMTTLATQAANGTYTETDREKIQAEINALTDEIDRIADNSNFNGQKLLDGSLDANGATINANDLKDSKALTLIGSAGGTPPVYHKNTANASKTSFTLDLRNIDNLNYKVTADAGEKMEVYFGGFQNKNVLSDDSTAIQIELKKDEVVTAKSLANAIEKQIAGNNNDNKVEIKLGQNSTTAIEYEVTNNGDGTLTFTMTDAGYETASAAYDAATATNEGYSSSDDNWDVFRGNFDVNFFTVAANDTKTADADQKGLAKELLDTKGGAINGTTVVHEGSASKSNQLFDASFDFLNYEVKDGAGLQIGDEYYVWATSKETLNKDYASNVKVVDLTDLDPEKLTRGFNKDGSVSGQGNGDTNALTEVFNRLTVAAKDNKTFAVQGQAIGFTLEITERFDNTSSADLTNKDGVDKVIRSFGGIDTEKYNTTGTSLSLQIGADSVETIDLKIDSMKADALGIKGLDISTREKANAAIDTINAAIEKVSVTRGNLGAVQNRLEHTINNLGVMEENIQDAEANIRDTDIADEMMAYTKNNILIQSAQAMLAQANQVPQGVLQLMG